VIDEPYGELLSFVRIIRSKFHQQKPSTRGKEIQVWRSLSLEPVDNASFKTFKPDRTEPQYLRNVVGRRKRIGIGKANERAVLRAAERYLDGLLVLRPAEAGMHLVADLAPALARRMDDQEAARRAAAAGIAVVPLSASYLQAPRRQGLLLGYAAVAEPAIAPAARRLAAALTG